MENRNSKSDLLVLVLGFTIIGLLAHNYWIIWAAVGVGCLSLLIPAFERFILFIWHKISQGMGWVMSKILLGAVFYLVLVPLSFLKKISGSKDSLRLKKSQSSMWVSRDHTYAKTDLVDLF